MLKQKTDKEKPNIIFYFSDQQRFDTLGCYGQKLPVTPNLDALAKEGVLMREAYTPQPVCGPARAMLQTGLYASQTGCFRNNIALPKNMKTLPMYMKEAGYELGYVGKWHLASDGEHEEAPRQGLDFHHKPIPLEHRGGWDGFWRASDVLEFTSHGYDGYVFDEQNNRLDFKGYRVDCITDYGLEFIDRQKEDKPFFLFMSHIEPHHQNDHGHYEGPEGSKEAFKDFEIPGDLAGFSGDYLEEYPDYLGSCHALDENLGRIVRKLKEKGIYDNTVIIYTSDHGSHFRTRNQDLAPGNYDDYKRSCHDSAIHIPMVFHGPGFQGGLEYNGLISLLDIPTTILGIGGIKCPSHWQGINLTKLDMDEECRDDLYIQISESSIGRAIRTKSWKYCVQVPGGIGGKEAYGDLYEEVFLYDLQADPFEKINLIDRGMDTSFLAQKVLGFMNQAKEPPAVIRGRHGDLYGR